MQQELVVMQLLLRLHVMHRTTDLIWVCSLALSISPSPSMQVLSIFQQMAEGDLFEACHLDMLWAVTEQEGTFDTVKVNVCDMVKDLAALLRPSYLDLLLAKLKVSKVGPGGWMPRCMVAYCNFLLDASGSIICSHINRSCLPAADWGLLQQPLCQLAAGMCCWPMQLTPQGPCIAVTCFPSICHVGALPG